MGSRRPMTARWVGSWAARKHWLRRISQTIRGEYSVLTHRAGPRAPNMDSRHRSAANITGPPSPTVSRTRVTTLGCCWSSHCMAGSSRRERRRRSPTQSSWRGWVAWGLPPAPAFPAPAPAPALCRALPRAAIQRSSTPATASRSSGLRKGPSWSARREATSLASLLGWASSAYTPACRPPPSRSRSHAATVRTSALAKVLCTSASSRSGCGYARTSKSATRNSGGSSTASSPSPSPVGRAANPL
mmetsp:Transcript_60938/g.193301  ORF Transcript_60938/g.193301 Transcript_60938/m.193301 type:complete len:245 (-) Transcript_60938:318-1052(-)